MQPSEINWRRNENSGFHSARFDVLSADGTHRLGQTENIAFWQDGRSHPYMFSGNMKPAMSALSFVLWLQGRCQVHYNEWGEF